MYCGLYLQMSSNLETLVCYARHLGIGRTIQILAWKTALAMSRQVRDSDLVDLYDSRISLAAGDRGLSKELKLFKS